MLLNPRNGTPCFSIGPFVKELTRRRVSVLTWFSSELQSGHQPAVLVWEVATHTCIAEMKTHKYGVSCVQFSPNGKSDWAINYYSGVLRFQVLLLHLSQLLAAFPLTVVDGGKNSIISRP